MQKKLLKNSENQALNDIKLIQKQVQALSGNAVDPTAADNRAKAQSIIKMQYKKAEKEALQKRKENKNFNNKPQPQQKKNVKPKN